MCCFSRHVPAVWDTRIFARRLGPDTQALAYAMGVQIPEDLAMILPLPVPPGASEHAVRFIDLQHGGKAAFFGYLEACFPSPHSLARASPSALGAKKGTTLKVHDVGAFVASFVPTLADFSRLDPRFRLPEDLWGEVPHAAEWAFAVFQFAAPRRGRFGLGAPPRVEVHPLAFTFPTRERQRLFFPTLHIHDGALRKTAAFNHTLYVQGDPVPGWERSPGPPHPNHVALLTTLLNDQLLSRRTLKGTLPNQDTYAEG